ncbi:hypothetical protein ASPWEDRAFT_120703 [Aspergillus wentii DTO 134E9]|uniref:Major facilitator superfamily (MFS) profile domain-containing protein n=1 Tax=Aspergillus wentii DTO 134E9 TaxID=1073089 RepID=A0A1L9R5Q6_ASPWE|nr:uncharacterized protein ASPWEDRAFT_120703 [Aspergillus wentii DTO 134E9]KAI9925285.1 hypothetical protein MW887_006212 [Aspergillus wentii]OJJ30217.1 hypothetical protein ASPWEDRAFT_120703 [Aspergillus wentii DTO 134E9]
MEVELHPRLSNSTHDQHEHDDAQLPPADGGKDAWLFLAACFVIEALIWGFSFAFGIFQNYYSTHEPFKGSGNTAIIGTCAMGVTYLLAPFIFGLLQSMPFLRRWATPAGFLIICLALALSSFSTTTTHLIFSQGIFYGIGASVAYAPTIIFMDEWFVKKKGMAFGTMWAGTGLSGVVLPLVLQWLLNMYGFQTTLRIWAIVVFVLAGPLLYFVKPRIPISSNTTIRPLNLSFLKDRTFLIYQLGNIIEALGFFLPNIYLPTYARTLGASNLTASLPVILINLASVFGCITMGSLSDRYHVTTCILISTVGSTLAIFVIWGFSISLAPLYIFCLAYGLFAGSFTSTWPAVSTEVRKRNNYAETGIVFGFLASGRGVGNVVSGPLSEALIKGFPWQNAAGGAYGSGYGALIVFTGVTALLGGFSVALRPLKVL